MKQSRRTRYSIRMMQEALISLMEEKPFSKITITDICIRADVNRSTFYVHFPDQTALRSSIESEILDQLKNTLMRLQTSSQVNRQYEILVAFLRYIQSNSKGVQTLMGHAEESKFQAEIVQLTFALIRPLNIEEYQSVYLISGSLGVIRHWIFQGCAVTPEEMARRILRLTM